MIVKLSARQGRIFAAIAFAMASSASTAAFAQNCTTNQTGTLNVTNIGQLAVPPGAASAALAGAIGNVNTAFLTQQGSAFVSAPSNPMPDQPGGGVWARAVGGQVNLNTTSVSTGVTTRSDGLVSNATTSAVCNLAPTLRG
jgi:hypothetical protein